MSALLLLATLLSSPALAAKGLAHETAVAPLSGQRWALLIGVDQYDDPTIHDLQYPDDDARTLGVALVDAGFEPSHVLVMVPDTQDPTLRPTRANILARIQALRLALSEGDELVVAFSGHGVSAEETDGRHDYFLPMDAQLLVPHDTALDLNLILARVDAVPVTRRLVLLDACRSSVTDTRGMNEGVWTGPEVEAATGTRILFAANFGKVSYEAPEASLGAFTHAMILGIGGAADGVTPGAPADGLVDADELYTYATIRLKERCAVTGQCQQPEQAGHWTGDVFPVVSASEAAGNRPRARATAAVSPAPAPPPAAPPPTRVEAPATRPRESLVTPASVAASSVPASSVSLASGSGYVTIGGDASDVWLVGGGKQHQGGGELPAGFYRVLASFNHGAPFLAGEVQLQAAERVIVTCSTAAGRCQVSR